jgi:predicted TIM-barrel fold metal-dependent hydrolase
MKRLPSEYFQDHIYLTFQDDIVAFQVSHLMNAKRLMWANDFPHSDSTWPNSQTVIDKLTVGVSEDIKQAILRDNVAELYKIPASG